MNWFKILSIVLVLVVCHNEVAAQRGRVNITRPGGRTYNRNPYGGHMGGGYNRGYHGSYHGGYHRNVNVHVHAHYGWYRPTWYYPVGWGIATIATTAIVVSAINANNNAAAAKSEDGKIYYDNGVYYMKTKDGYEVIPAPKGAEIPKKSIPDGYTMVKKGDQEYLYAAGTFYEETTNGNLTVIKAPIGVEVPYLPKEGIKEEEYEGTTYYELNGSYYLPIQMGTEVMYKVTPKPGTNANDAVNNQTATASNPYPDYEHVTLNSVKYYYAKGKFYVQQAGELVEVIAPINAEVKTMPADAENIEGKDGGAYYKVGNTYFQASAKDGKYIYVVVAKPD